MKRFLPTLLIAGGLVAGGARAADDIVYIDLQEVFKRFYKTQLAQDQIKQQADDIKLEREDMELDIKEMKAEVVRAEAEIPLALADAFRSGNLGVMDYVKYRNVEADTSMRKAIA